MMTQAGPGPPSAERHFFLGVLVDLGFYPERQHRLGATLTLAMSASSESLLWLGILESVNRNKLHQKTFFFPEGRFRDFRAPNDCCTVAGEMMMLK
jgi:hypothetical protein